MCRICDLALSYNIFVDFLPRIIYFGRFHGELMHTFLACFTSLLLKYIYFFSFFFSFNTVPLFFQIQSILIYVPLPSLLLASNLLSLVPASTNLFHSLGYSILSQAPIKLCLCHGHRRILHDLNLSGTQILHQNPFSVTTGELAQLNPTAATCESFISTYAHAHPQIDLIHQLLTTQPPSFSNFYREGADTWLNRCWRCWILGESKYNIGL